MKYIKKLWKDFYIFHILFLISFLGINFCKLYGNEMPKDTKNKEWKAEEKNMPENLIIIGSGPAGLTAAIYASRLGLDPVVIEGKQPGGQLTTTTYIENWPGIKQIFGVDLMANLRAHAESLDTNFIEGVITKIDFSKIPFTLWTDQNKKLLSKSIIIATGAKPRKLGCPGEEEYWGKGVSSCAICDGPLYRNKKVIVVGGGHTALEYASFLAKYAKEVLIVHLLDKFTAPTYMQEKVISNTNVSVKFNSTIISIEGEGEKGSKRVTGAVVKNILTNTVEKIPVEGIFVAIGTFPNSEIFKDQLKIDSAGYIETQDEVKTSVSGVFAAGDVADPKYRQAVTSASSGCKAALEAERFLISENSKAN